MPDMDIKDLCPRCSIIGHPIKLGDRDVSQVCANCGELFTVEIDMGVLMASQRAIDFTNLVASYTRSVNHGRQS